MEEALRRFQRHPRPVKLRGAEMAYDWGDDTFIARLLGRPGPARIAELWMGAHPGGPSVAVVDNHHVELRHLTQALPAETLGAAHTEFGGLPYLLKVLSAATPLSIQAHPSKPQAQAGFARENQAGKHPKDPTRSYKDDNHKPELICALTDFHALRGFRPLQEISALLHALPELASVAAGFQENRDGLRALYTRLMRLPQQLVDAALTPLVERLRRRHAQAPFGLEHWESWLLRADGVFSGAHKDRGLFSVLLLNLVHLRPGQAMYLPAGELHAYLRGTGMEVMASSDNVLRGGLTPKHVDVDELLRTLTFNAGRPDILARQPTERPGEHLYRTPAQEFELRVLQLAPGQELRRPAASAPEILVVTEGTGHLHSARGDLPLATGEITFIPPGVETTLATDADLTVYSAGMPGRR